MQLKRGRRGGQMLGHAQDRRNADPVHGHQHDARGRRIEREMVPRFAGTDESARLDGIDQGGTAAARGRLAQDPDEIAMLLARIVAERVLARQARRNLDVDMRARSEPRQWFASGIDELEARDVIGFFRSASFVFATNLRVFQSRDMAVFESYAKESFPGASSNNGGKGANSYRSSLFSKAAT